MAKANKKTYKIAVDAMGGDFAPTEVIKGVEQARDRLKDVEFIVYGRAAKLNQLIQNEERITVVNAKQTIKMDEEPVKAVRTKKESSLVLAAQAVKTGEADALFSAGNTGALLASAIFIVGRMKHIDRPALAVALPNVAGKHDYWVLMDAGANAQNRPEQLYQYGILGRFYAQTVLNYKNPSVRLLNNGAEEDKGDETHKIAHQLLKQNKKLNFKGNAESRDLLQGVADVVVSDGFTGNATLKAIEGTVLSLLGVIKNAIMDGGVSTKIGGSLIKPAMKDVQSRLDYNEAGGAVILGVKAPVVKAHGSSKAPAVANSLEQLHTMLNKDLIKETTTFVNRNQRSLATAKNYLVNEKNE